MTGNSFNWDSYVRFIEEFKNESDRAAVILGAAKLDALLAQILDRFLLPSLSSSDELLEGDSPLSSFSARINISYRLGIITPEFAKALHGVRKVRNSFAHDIAGCSLESGPQSDRVKSLLLPLRPLAFYKRFKDRFFGEESSCTVEFKTYLAMMTARLEACLVSTETISNEGAWNFIKKAWADATLDAKDGPEGEA